MIKSYYEFKKYYMENKDFVTFFMFWERYNYGSVMTERFSSVNTPDYISKGTILRRLPDRSSKEVEDPCILIDIDNINIIEFGYDLYKYLLYSPDFVGGRQFDIKDTSVKIVFISVQKQYLIKAPLSYILILANENIEEFNSLDYYKLLRERWIRIR